MLLLIIYWLLTFILITLTGKSISSWNNWILKNKKETDLETLFLIGFIFTNIITAYWSLFAAVEEVLMAIIILINVISVVIYYKSFKEFIIGTCAAIQESSTKSTLLVFCTILFIAIVASDFIWTFDTKLYHAQAVHWIRTYPVIPGLANLQPQFGLNSMFFPVSALFTWDYFSSESIIFPINAIAFIALLLKCLNLLNVSRIKQNYPDQVLYIWMLGIMFLLFTKSANSLSNDIICANLIIYLFIVIHNKKSVISDNRVLLYSSLIALGITFKLSSIFTGFLILYLLLDNFSVRLLGKIILGLILIVLPFFIRNYYLSGYLIFPFTILDLFDPVWKVPHVLSEFEQVVIQSWAKLPRTNPQLVKMMSISEWFPVWYKNLDGIIKVLLYLNIAYILLGPYYFITRNKKTFGYWAFISASLLFWWLMAPSPRFAFGFIILGSGLLMSEIVFISQNYLPKKLVSYGTSFLLCSFILSVAYYHREYYKQVYVSPIALIIPKSFKNTQSELVHTNFYYYKSLPENTCNYRPFPCVTRPLGHVILIGQDIRQGMRIEPKEGIE